MSERGPLWFHGRSDSLFFRIAPITLPSYLSALFQELNFPQNSTETQSFVQHFTQLKDFFVKGGILGSQKIMLGHIGHSPNRVLREIYGTFIFNSQEFSGKGFALRSSSSFKKLFPPEGEQVFSEYSHLHGKVVLANPYLSQRLTVENAGQVISAKPNSSSTAQLFELRDVIYTASQFLRQNAPGIMQKLSTIVSAETLAKLAISVAKMEVEGKIQAPEFYEGAKAWQEIERGGYGLILAQVARFPASGQTLSSMDIKDAQIVATNWEGLPNLIADTLQNLHIDPEAKNRLAQTLSGFVSRILSGEENPPVMDTDELISLTQRQRVLIIDGQRCKIEKDKPALLVRRNNPAVKLVSSNIVELIVNNALSGEGIDARGRRTS